MTAQDEFDKTYISSSEICTDLGVSREALLQARRRGTLPEPVQVRRPNGDAHVMLWLRAQVAPAIEAWRTELTAKRVRAA